MSKTTPDDLKVYIALQNYAEWMATDEGAEEQSVNKKAAAKRAKQMQKSFDEYAESDGRGGKKELFFTIDL